MTLRRRRGSAQRNYHARHAWLSADPTRYAGVPGLNDDVTDDNRAALDALCAEMLALKLLGAACVEIRRETVRRLISELRGERVELGW